MEDIKDRPYWHCEECGYENYTRAMPRERDVFYARVATKGSPICPRCKSESFMPVGY